jgi:hypothetical protein
MFDLEAVVDCVRLDDRHSPGSADEGRSRSRGRGTVEWIGRIVMRRASGYAKQRWVGHRG